MIEQVGLDGPPQRPSSVNLGSGRKAKCPWSGVGVVLDGEEMDEDGRLSAGCASHHSRCTGIQMPL